MIGQTLGHYRVLELLGKGGMGEVYRAEDTTLGREVAIKVLPQAFTGDPERLARFEREAKLLATLNHPHIAQIHALEDVDGQKLLVMELVEGETLAERLVNGAVPLEEALPLALQITQALEAAHERGIVHRDLKPGNIKITPEGEVKVLDFGLAKPITDSASGDLTHSPTLTYSPTRAGVLLGTASYMSPEQARGQEVDRRTDIWSFGVVLWEMITGRQLFGGETVSDILAGVLKEEPPWERLPADLSRPLQRVLHRCLTRDPKERLHDIADARLDIEEAIAFPERTADPEREPTQSPTLWNRVRTSRWALPAAILVGALAVGLAWWLLEQQQSSTSLVVRTTVPLPEGADIESSRSSVAISPDGEWLVFAPVDATPPRRLYRRSLSQFKASPMPGVDRGMSPFFSPDGQWVGYYDLGDQHWMKIPIEGGSPVRLAAAVNPWGATWGSNGEIVFGEGNTGLWRVSEAGGEAIPVLLPDLEKGVTDYEYPQFLPGETALLYSADKGGLTAAATHVGVLDLVSGETSILIEGALAARYLRTGHLLYGKAGVGYIAPFDVDRLEITGPAIQVPEPLLVDEDSWDFPVAVSDNGTLVFVPAEEDLLSELVYVDLRGNQEVLPVSPSKFCSPQLSPDGNKIAVTIRGRGESNIWIIDPSTGMQTKLLGEGRREFPLWSSDGQRVAFAMETQEPPASWGIFWQSAEAGTPHESLLMAQEPGEKLWPYSISTEQNLLLYGRSVPTAEGLRGEIWYAPLDGSSAPQQFAAIGADVDKAALSPDEKWIAYFAYRDDGQGDLLVQSFPDGGQRFRVSTEPVGTFLGWSPDTTRLYYIREGSLKEIPVSTASGFRAGVASDVFHVGQWWDSPWGELAVRHDLAPDGRRFLMVRTDWAKSKRKFLYVVQNWFEELERLAPTSRN